MSDKVGLIVCGKEEIKIPLESISIQANIYGLLAHFEAAFTYVNSTKDPIEVEFKHPLHSDSVLVGIEAVIDGKVIKGIVKEKEEAKAVYEDVISSGGTALLVKEETQDIIGIALGNLAPGKMAEVKLQLLQQMEVEEQGIHLLLPTTLKPRYELTTEPSIQQQPPINQMANPFHTPNLTVLPAIYKFSFELFLMGNIGKLTQIISPSHPLEEFVAKDGRKGMHLISPDPLNTDLVAYIDYEDIHPLSAMIEPSLQVREEKPAEHPFIDNPAVLLTFMPKSSHADLNIRGEYIFVIDQSGSMSGNPILNARDTLDMLLRSLSPGSYFNIIGFGSQFHPLFPEGSRPYAQTTLDIAVNHVKKLTASLGGTEILSPLKHIFSKEPVPGLARQVFLLTDGGVSNTTAVVKAVSDNAHNTRVFTFGIGSGVSTDLVKDVARAGKGKAVFISGKDRMQSRVMEVMNIAMSPSYTNITVTGSKQMAVYPKTIPVLFENEPFVVVAFFTEKIIKGEKVSATLKYSSDSETKATTVEFSLADSVTALSPQLPPQLVHQFGVSKALRDLEKGVSGKEECVTLSCYANILCKHTAFVAVREDQDRVVEGSMKVYNLKMSSIYMDDMMMLGAPPPPMALLGSAAPPPPMVYSAALPERTYSATRAYHSAASLPPLGSMSYAAPKRRSRAAQMDIMDDGLGDDDSDDEVEESSLDLITPKSARASSSKPLPAGHQSIMTLQKAEGNWEYSEEIDRLLSCKDSKKLCPSEVKNLQIWVTLLCIACLQVRFQEYKSEWLLMTKKGERWVQSQLGGGEGKPTYQHLLKLATEFLQK